MVRFIAAAIFLLIGGYAAEVYTGADFGVERSLQWMFHSGFAGGYAVATGVTSVIVGGMFGN